MKMCQQSFSFKFPLYSQKKKKKKEIKCQNVFWTTTNTLCSLKNELLSMAF